MEFLYPIAFALLPLPWLARKLMAPAPLPVNGALRLPYFHKLAAGATGNRRAIIRSPLTLILMVAIWLLLLVALARPVLMGDEVALPAEHRDLMFAVDLSGSMDQQDFLLGGQVSNRLSVVKAAADDFIDRRIGDRVGLVLFSDRAYVQAPLTLDRQVVRKLLDQAQVGLTGQKTAIGDAIAISVKRLKDRPANSRVLILLTDGASNAGVLNPLKAAGIAKELGIRIYTIGVGARQMQVQTAYGKRLVNPSEDLDEGTLTAIADLTGGQYFRASDTSALAKVYTEIDKLEPAMGEPDYVRPSVSLFHLPAGLAMLLTLFLVATYWWRRADRPRRRPLRQTLQHTLQRTSSTG